MTDIVKNVENAEDIITIDGIKLFFEDGWTLIRPSGTEPIFRIFVEANTFDKSDTLMKKGIKLVSSSINKVSSQTKFH